MCDKTTGRDNNLLLLLTPDPDPWLPPPRGRPGGLGVRYSPFGCDVQHYRVLISQWSRLCGSHSRGRPGLSLNRADLWKRGSPPTKERHGQFVNCN